MSRHKPAWGSQLKVWIVTKLGPGKLGIQCPSCRNKAIVSPSRWGKAVKKRGILKGSHTRPCTYCFATAWTHQKHKDEFNERNLDG